MNSEHSVVLNPFNSINLIQFDDFMNLKVIDHYIPFVAKQIKTIHYASTGETIRIPLAVGLKEETSLRLTDAQWAKVKSDCLNQCTMAFMCACVCVCKVLQQFCWGMQTNYTFWQQPKLDQRYQSQFNFLRSIQARSTKLRFVSTLMSHALSCLIFTNT